ncbi:MAG TPA: hypothetical protein VH593_31885 [Ktedonobacteraceae bacterium]|jgi:hypothetical protein
MLAIPIASIPLPLFEPGEARRVLWGAWENWDILGFKRAKVLTGERFSGRILSVEHIRLYVQVSW